ncbi:MAG: glycosyltransferase family 39 protein [Microscillaceae bacterium]|jgi:hypothetical protein|nr:glycosyltransferase family 39 protein [Microscillaceae bacterium]
MMPNTRVFFSLFLLIYGLIQYYTLAYSPLPWFDEVVFASISQSFGQTGTLQVPAAAFSDELKLYGFVYFLLTNVSWWIGGFGIFQFRVVNLLFGIAVVWQTFLLVKDHTDLNPPAKAGFLLFALMLTDPFFYLCLHEGRMDLTAVFWLLLGIRYSLQNFQKPQITLTILIAFFFSLAMLTTPRSGFVILAVALVTLWWICQDLKKRGYLVIWGLGSGVFFYSFWIFYAYGGWGNFWNYFFKASVPINRQGTAVSEYVGSIGYIPRQEYLLIAIVIATLGLGIWKKSQAYFQFLLGIIGLSLLFFYTLVLDLGPSSSYILPFYYFLIFKSLGLFEWHYKNPVLLLIGILLMYNFSYFGAKNVQVWASMSQRDYRVAEAFVQKHIPPQSRVISEPMYFYAVEKNQAKFQMMDEYETLPNREQFHRQIFDYQYFILTDHLRWRKPEIVAYYQQKATLIAIARLELPPSAWSLWIDKLGLLSTTERTGYSCTIYKRVK